MDAENLYQEAITTFRGLLDDATRAGDPEPTAMTLATSNADGRVAARMVLLKAVDERGFTFYTNYQSAKAEQIAAHSQAALCFLWKTLRGGSGVQVRVEGKLELTTATESDAYFASRARDSQIGAWASAQSQTLPSRDAFYERIAEFEKKFEGVPVPRPPHWGGYRVVPDLIELWYGQRARLHERDRYELNDGRWSKRMLYP
ncbi:MAG TPA: pyridoxamine 5'-phosphate oxidase [Rudaea sp.]|jgi:pyridoxamine 5'-phosphate oxidase|nr:pyridoxamine 5'-phosphate oxidase [Rudaea sp.]